MNPNGENLFLIKVAKRQDYADQFLRGDLYSQRLDYFRGIEGDKQRGDSFEATMVYPPGSIFTPEWTDPITKKRNVWSIPPQDHAANIRLQLNALKYLNVFCMYAVDFGDFKEIPNDDTKRTIELPETLWEFGDYAVAVFDVPEFIRRVARAALFRHYVVRRGRVVYYDPWLGLPDVPLDESVAFFKRNQYAHQKEFRLAFNTFTIGTNPITLSIGGISDIAIPVNKENIYQKLSVEVYTDPTIDTSKT